MSRRGFLRGLAYGGASLAGVGALGACGTEGTSGPRSQQPTAEDLSAQEKELTISNWVLYIDPPKQKDSTLKDFQRQTGITVNYTTDINDNSEFFAKIRPQLAAGQDTGRDLIVLTDWMAAKLIQLNYLMQVDKANVPLVNDNILPSLAAPSWDPDRSYSAPWQSGLTGMAYNARLTKEVRTFDELLTRPDLKGKVTLLTEMRDTMGLALLDLGYDPADFTAEQFAEAIGKVQRAVDSGQIRAFTGNEYARGLANGDIAACVAWSGDVIQLQFEDPSIKFVSPEGGPMIWSDNMLIPALAQHKTNAEKWMNFYYDPEVAAELAAWVNYICPVQGAQEAMRKFDKSLVDNQLIFPDEETLSQTHVFAGLTEEQDRAYNEQFQQLIGA